MVAVGDYVGLQNPGDAINFDYDSTSGEFATATGKNLTVNWMRMRGIGLGSPLEMEKGDVEEGAQSFQRHLIFEATTY